MICVITRNEGTPEEETVDLDSIDLERFEVKEVGKGIANYTVAEVSRGKRRLSNYQLWDSKAVTLSKSWGTWILIMFVIGMGVI
jgi:hypothetical protein